MRKSPNGVGRRKSRKDFGKKMVSMFYFCKACDLSGVFKACKAIFVCKDCALLSIFFRKVYAFLGIFFLNSSLVHLEVGRRTQKSHFIRAQGLRNESQDDSLEIQEIILVHKKVEIRNSNFKSWKIGKFWCRIWSFSLSKLSNINSK